MKFFGRMSCAVALFCACASVGKAFPTARVADLRPGSTTQAEVVAMFGQPWRTGIDDGLVTWSYARYAWSVFGGSSATDLVVRFDAHGVLASYTFNTTEPMTPRR